MIRTKQDTKLAHKNSLGKVTRRDALRRMAAKGGFYDGQQGRDRNWSGYKDFEITAYRAGYDLGVAAGPGVKHPFGEITNQRVPA